METLKSRVNEFRKVNGNVEAFKAKWLLSGNGELMICSKQGLKRLPKATNENYFNFDGRFSGLTVNRDGTDAIDWKSVKSRLEKQEIEASNRRGNEAINIL